MERVGGKPTGEWVSHWRHLPQAKNKRLEGVTLAQAATGELLPQMGGNLQGSHSTDSLQWDSSLTCMAQLGGMAKASLLNHIKFIKNFF